MITLPEMPALEFIDQCIRLEANGKIIWRLRPRSHFASQRAWNTWNARFADTTVGAPDGHGYLRFHLRWKNRSLTLAVHRIVFLLTTRRWPDGELDHRNGKIDDNRFENLRPADRSGQMQNAGKPSNNTSGFKGVSWDITRKCWQAGIKLHGKRIALGRFVNPDEAYAAYLVAKARLHTFQPEQR